MFYLREFYLRLKFLLFSLILVILICYHYKSTIFIILILCILKYEKNNVLIDIDHFIYTHPTELLKTYLIMILLLSFIFILPFIFWQCLDFLKSSLYSKEYTFLKFILFLLILSLCIFNIFFFLILFPKIWFLFEKFNQSTDSTLSLKFLFELKVQDYLTFLFDFIYFSNLSLIFLLILYFFINYLGIENLIHWKKLFIFINIVFATLLSPPDISSQLFLLFFLTILFEIIIFIYIFIFKIDKYIKINKVTC